MSSVRGGAVRASNPRHQSARQHSGAARRGFCLVVLRHLSEAVQTPGCLCSMHPDCRTTNPRRVGATAEFQLDNESGVQMHTPQAWSCGVVTHIGSKRGMGNVQRVFGQWLPPPPRICPRGSISEEKLEQRATSITQPTNNTRNGCLGIDCVNHFAVRGLTILSSSGDRGGVELDEA